MTSELNVRPLITPRWPSPGGDLGPRPLPGVWQARSPNRAVSLEASAGAGGPSGVRGAMGQVRTAAEVLNVSTVWPILSGGPRAALRSNHLCFWVIFTVGIALWLFKLGLSRVFPTACTHSQDLPVSPRLAMGNGLPSSISNITHS